MTEQPHTVVVRTQCPDCGADAYHVVTIPKLATGELFPVVGRCDACDVEHELWGMGPLQDVEGTEANPTGPGGDEDAR